MNKKIKAALISVFYKEGLDTILQLLHKSNVTIYSTGGTQNFIESLNIPCIAVESLTNYPSILGGRVKTLHPSVFGGILAKRSDDTHVAEMKQYNIPEIDLVITGLYPFEETKASTNDETAIIEKIDIGGVALIRAAAKNYNDVMVIASTKQYESLQQILQEQNVATTLEQRKSFAAAAFEIVAHYDISISNYFNDKNLLQFVEVEDEKQVLRYGENPHQQATFYGDIKKLFTQLHGKELSYNNLVDVDAALQLMKDLSVPNEATFAIIKHTNVCGAAQRATVKQAWDIALASDSESAFGGVLICDKNIDAATAEGINTIFFEILIAPSFDEAALQILQSKKNRILLQQHASLNNQQQCKAILNGMLVQDVDEGNTATWKEVGGRNATEIEKEDLLFANIICKHLKSNSIALVKSKQLIGKGCGQTSRIDSLRQAIEKAKQFKFDLTGAVLASDAFFPFDDCVKIAHGERIAAFIQPGGSIRDNDSIQYCKDNNLAMVITEMRHFKH